MITSLWCISTDCIMVTVWGSITGCFLLFAYMGVNTMFLVCVRVQRHRQLPPPLLRQPPVRNHLRWWWQRAKVLRKRCLSGRRHITHVPSTTGQLAVQASLQHSVLQVRVTLNHSVCACVRTCVRMRVRMMKHTFLGTDNDLSKLLTPILVSKRT